VVYAESDLLNLYMHFDCNILFANESVNLSTILNY